MPLALRSPTPSDIDPCSRILYQAFHDIAVQHGFPPDFPTLDHAVHLIGALIASPATYGVVAEQDGRVVGSNFMSESDPIRGVGPITVDPSVQGSGVGRQLMEAVIERGRGAPGVRLLQDAFNSRSMSLYASLGFEVKEPTVMIQGRPRSRAMPGWTVRPMELSDVDECAKLCRRIHGFDRANELRHSAAPWVALRDGRITAYATALSLWVFCHAVADSEEDMAALLLGFAAARPDLLWFLLPTRQAGLFRWCLREGLKVIKPMTLMAMGAYQEPAGCWFPSVMY
ncbi:MAG: GNAT family N-acetyltransferase [Acidobacteriota bacterium]|nr:GNAT family N-acetyltransferase [Acidobacteriota bacterium]